MPQPAPVQPFQHAVAAGRPSGPAVRPLRVAAWAAALCLAATTGVALAQPAPASPPSLVLVPPPQAAVRPPVGRVTVEDRTLHSAALARDVTYRVLLPAGYHQSVERYPVLYLLHGLTGTFTDWEQRTQLARWLEAYRLIVVMPEGQNSWYSDSIARASDRFETYILDDLVADVETHYRAIASRHARAIAGLSMGGYGAMKFALKRPGAFAVAASFSGAFSLVRSAVPATPTPPPANETPFSRTVRESVTAAFGPPGSDARAANDLFALAGKADPARLPYLYLDCGTEDGLVAVNREFVALLHTRKVPFEYHEVPGAHTWDYWDRQVVEFLRVLARRVPIGGPLPH